MLVATVAMGCSTATGSLAEARKSPPPTTAHVAALSTLGSGTIDCTIPHGCTASLLVRPGSGAQDWTATYADPRFPSNLGEVDGPAIGAPATLSAGDYRLAGVVSEISDLPSPGFSDRPLLWSEARCVADLTVKAGTARVSVAVVFSATGPCRINVTSS